MIAQTILFREAFQPPQIMRTRHVDGIIMPGQPAKPYYRMITVSGIPAVFLDFYDEQGIADSVAGDNTYGCSRLTSRFTGVPKESTRIRKDKLH